MESAGLRQIPGVGESDAVDGFGQPGRPPNLADRPVTNGISVTPVRSCFSSLAVREGPVAPELKRRIVETLMAGPVQARCGVHACDYPVPGLQPFPPKEGWAVRLVQCRTVLGLTQTE